MVFLYCLYFLKITKKRPIMSKTLQKLVFTKRYIGPNPLRFLKSRIECFLYLIIARSQQGHGETWQKQNCLFRFSKKFKEFQFCQVRIVPVNLKGIVSFVTFGCIDIKCLFLVLSRCLCQFQQNAAINSPALMSRILASL